MGREGSVVPLDPRPPFPYTPPVRGFCPSDAIPYACFRFLPPAKGTGRATRHGMRHLWRAYGCRDPIEDQKL
jgi:hypothetical protein